MNSTLWILLAVAVVVIAVLAVVAARLLWLLRRQRQAERRREEEVAAQRERLNQGLQVLARCIESDQVGLAEASIRVSVLLDGLAVPAPVREEFSAFYQLAAAVDHIPTHSDWQTLEAGERRRYEHELQRQETVFASSVRDAAQRLRGRTF